jgi:hypothetical protein
MEEEAAAVPAAATKTAAGAASAAAATEEEEAEGGEEGGERGGGGGGKESEKSLSLADLKTMMADFANARDWGKFHSPRNLLLALVILRVFCIAFFRVSIARVLEIQVS